MSFLPHCYHVSSWITDLLPFRSHEKAKKYLASKQKNIALSYLRSKRHLEDLLAKRVASSEQLRAVIRSIDQAKGDIEVSLLIYRSHYLI